MFCDHDEYLGHDSFYRVYRYENGGLVLKVGDLVTLSSYCLQRTDMRRWRNDIWFEKKPLVGLIVKIEENPWKESKKFMSANEKLFYFVNWVQEGPASRWGRTFHQTDGYFLRNDLRYVKKGDFKK
jgi:hypothetical protein